MKLDPLRELSPRDRALVAMAVLLDGFDAETYLQDENGANNKLSIAAGNLVSLPAEMRLPLAGTLFRQALTEIEGS